MRWLMVSLGFLLGGILGLFGAFGAEYVARVRREEGERYGDFTAVLAGVRRDLSRGLQAVFPRRSNRPADGQNRA